MGLLTVQTVEKFEFPKIQAGGWPRSKKTVTSPYLRNRLTDFDETWHADADWPCTGDRSLKFPFFFKNQCGGGRHLEKKHKIAILHQRIGTSSRNLARLCKMGLLTAQTVTKFEFPKSKMADGRHFENS